MVKSIKNIQPRADDYFHKFSQVEKPYLQINGKSFSFGETDEKDIFQYDVSDAICLLSTGLQFSYNTYCPGNSTTGLFVTKIKDKPFKSASQIKLYSNSKHSALITQVDCVDVEQQEPVDHGND